MAVYEIPIISRQQTFQATFPNGSYRVRLIYCDVPEVGWILDLADTAGNPVVSGIPLVTGVDLLAQYPYLFNFKMYCATDGAPSVPPTFGNLGQIAHLWVQF